MFIRSICIYLTHSTTARVRVSDLVLIPLLGLALLCAVAAHGQSLFGSRRGMAQDESGGVLTDTQVMVSSGMRILTHGDDRYGWRFCSENMK